MVHVFEGTDLFLDYDYNTTDEFIPDPNTVLCVKSLSSTVARLLCFTYIAIFHMAIAGNALVVLVIWVNRRTLTPSEVYLFHLTIADFLLALTLPFWATQAGYQSWIFGDFMCKFISLLTEANFYTSILFLVCISIDRYVAIVCAGTSRVNRQRYCSWCACASIWAIGVALALPALFKDAFELNGPQKIACAEHGFGPSIMWKLITRILRHVLGFLLPLVVMVTCYGITIARLLRTRGFKKHRAMRVIIAVVAVFLLCWTPYHLATVIDTVMRLDLLEFDCAARKSVDTAELITKSLAVSHCCINPWLYALLGERFRGHLGNLKFRRTATSRQSISRSTSQTSDVNGPVF